MPTVVVFNTQEEADTLQNRDYLQARADLNDPTMEAWDIPRQKLNGDWTYMTYHNANYDGYTLEEYDENNYYQG